MKKFLAVALIVCLAIIPLAGCKGDGGEPATDGKYDSLVIGTVQFEEKWNPFLAESAYDMQVLNQIFNSVMQVGPGNALIDSAGTITGEEITADDGHTQVLYTLKIRDDITYSDGTPVTIDDLLFYYYVISDPTYTGPSATFYTYDIVGIKEYYYDDPNYSATIAGFEQEVADKYTVDTISEEDYLAFLVGSNLDGWWDAKLPGDLDGAGLTWAQYIIDEGFEAELNEIDQNDPQAMLELLAKVEYANYADGYDPSGWWLEKLSADYIKGNLEDGIDVPEIEGIKKVDDYTCTVLFDSINFIGERIVNGTLVPKHYYDADYTKGDVSKIVGNFEPMGSGPYKWGGFADNIATLTANDSYFEGEPKIKTVKYQVVQDNDILPQMTAGNIDIANPTIDPTKKDEFEGAGFVLDLIDNNGYGYIGLNAQNMDTNVRKGMMHLFNRYPAVEGYYGDLASVIERPMTTTLAEYPTSATEFYGYDPAKALEFFEAAGYAKDSSGKLMRGGEQLHLSVYVGGDGIGNHPAYSILTQAQSDMEEMGAILDIQDVAFNVLQAAMNDGTADMFCLAWGASNDCDKTTIYHSTGGQNRTHLSDPRIDDLLGQITKEIDLEARSALVSQMLDLVMESATEMPVYQRKNAWAYNPEVVNIDSLPETSTYWTFENVLWQIELN